MSVSSRERDRARRALSHRFAYLVNELGIPPGNILCETFTNKSANEMRRRIHCETADEVARRDRYLRGDDGDGTLPIGQRVRSAVFGEGTVLDVNRNKGAHVIRFDGMGTPRSISLRAKLEKIGP